MNYKKLSLFILISLSVLLILSGCSNAGISLSLRPNPIEFSESPATKELKLTVTTTGFGSLSLDNLIVQVIDEDDNDNVIFGDEKEIDITSNVISGISETVSYTLDLEKIYTSGDYDNYTSFTDFYNDFLQGETHTLRITVTGSNDETLTAQINYN